MSRTLTQLSYDLASFFNVSNSKAFEKLSAAMAGQVKPLREYGIDISVASLQEYALAKNINLSVREMTQAQKATLRYNYILEKTKSIHGDLARTINTPANAMRIFNAQLEKVQRAIGNIISLVVSKFLPYIQAGVMLLSDFADNLAKKWGFELPKIDYSSMGLDTVSESVDEIEDTTADLVDDFADATTEAKKLKNQLMGFDELNILRSPTAETSTTASKGKTGNAYPSDLGLNVPTYDFGLDTISSKAKEIYNRLKNLSPKAIFDELGRKIKGVLTWFNNLRNSVKLLIGLIAGAFAVHGIEKFISWVAKAVTTFTTFTSGVRNAEGALGKLERGAGVAIGSIVAGFSSFSFFSDLTKGTLEWYDALIEIPSAAAGIGVAFATGGPIGGLIAVLSAAAGAAFGVATGLYEIEKSKAIEKFMSGNGASFTELTDALSNTLTAVQNTYDGYNSTFSELNQNDEDIRGIVDNISLIGDAMTRSAGDVASNAETIKGELARLQTGVETQTKLIYEGRNALTGFYRRRYIPAL